ncbi:hypothetical protein BHE17_03590 [Planococcus maritimus]|nr:hypothetical protein AY633_15915 [Planococcus maritimus]OED31663.1 hypothetical protein BHE17_03590 [Planococcus maritimus]
MRLQNYLKLFMLTSMRDEIDFFSKNRDEAQRGDSGRISETIETLQSAQRSKQLNASPPESVPLEQNLPLHFFNKKGQSIRPGL